MAQKVAKALADAQSPVNLLNIVQDFSAHLDQPEVLTEIVGKAQKIGALLKKLQGVAKILKIAAGK